MSSELAKNAWPLGGYAPGNYTCKCLDCKVEFAGDKRAIQCLECAVMQAQKAHSAVRNDAMEADNTICSQEARIEALEAENARLREALARIEVRTEPLEGDTEKDVRRDMLHAHKIARRILSALAEPAGEAEPVAEEDEREDRIAALPYPDEAPASEVLAYVLSCAQLWVPEARIIGNARAGDIVRALTTPPARAIREALEKIIAAADTEPFTSIGHVIEHTVLDARAALAGSAE